MPVRLLIRLSQIPFLIVNFRPRASCFVFLLLLFNSSLSPKSPTSILATMYIVADMIIFQMISHEKAQRFFRLLILFSCLYILANSEPHCSTELKTYCSVMFFFQFFKLFLKFHGLLYEVKVKRDQLNRFFDI